MTDAPSAIETSNYLKHTHANPIQRRLIDRFHRVLVRAIADLAPASFLDAGCGEGFVAEVLVRQLPGLSLAGFDFNPASVAVATAKVPGASFQTASIFEIPFPDRAVVLSVPHEPYFCLANAVRGKNLAVRPRGSDPDHRNFWTRRAFGAFVNQTLDVEWLGGSFPWTICVARKRRAV